MPVILVLVIVLVGLSLYGISYHSNIKDGVPEEVPEEVVRVVNNSLGDGFHIQTAQSSSSNTSVLGDSYINSYYSSTNYGTNTYMTAGTYGSAGSRKYRPVLHMQMPSGTGIINEVILSLYCFDSGRYTAQTTNDYDLHKLNMSFVENEVSWNENESGTSWAAAGGDYGAIVDTTSLTAGTVCDTSPAWYNWTLLGDGATSNISLDWDEKFSVIIKENGEDATLDRNDGFRSSEQGGFAPILYYTYTLLSTPANITTFALSDDDAIDGDTITVTVGIQNSSDGILDDVWFEWLSGSTWMQGNITDAINGTNVLAFETTPLSANHSVRVRANDTNGTTVTSGILWLNVHAIPDGFAVTGFITILINDTLENSSLIMLENNETRNVTFYLPSNYTNTYIWMNQTLVVDAYDIQYVQVFTNRTLDENKSRPFNIIVESNGFTNSTVRLETRIYSRPSVLFNNWSATPGTLNENSEPWDSWDSASSGFCRSAVSGIAEEALCYYDTSSQSELDDARAKAQSFTVNTGTDGTRGDRLTPYILAYDWLQPLLNASEDIHFREKMAAECDALWNQEGNAISCVDHQLKTLPVQYVCGVVLGDYWNWSLPYENSTPDDWLGAVDDLYVLDRHHPTYNAPMIKHCADNVGNDAIGTYRSYYENDFALLTVVYDWVNGDGQMFTDYPKMKTFWLQLVRHNLPNRVTPSYCTQGNVKYSGVQQVVDKFTGDEQGWLYNYINNLPNTTGDLAPREESGHQTYISYLTYNGSGSASIPTFTGYADREAFVSVFRTNWTRDSHYIAIYNHNFTANNYRVSQHNDQLSVDIYGLGDSVIPDCGEVKYNYYGYGQIIDAVGHNVLLISDDDTTTVRGLDKGLGTFSTYVFNEYVGSMTGTFVEYAHIKTPYSKFEHSVDAVDTALWERAAGMVDGRYMFVIDYLNRSVNTTTLWRLGSFNLNQYTQSYSDNTVQTVSVGVNKSWTINMGSNVGNTTWAEIYWASKSGSGNLNIYINGNLAGTQTYENLRTYTYDINSSLLTTGNNTVILEATGTLSTTINYVELTTPGEVVGNLELNGTLQNWQSIVYGTQYKVGGGNLITWNTTSVYGDDVRTQLFSSPYSEQQVMKYQCRISSYTGQEGEVVMPLTNFQYNAATPYIRATIIDISEGSSSPLTKEVLSSGAAGEILNVSDGVFQDTVFALNGTPQTANNIYLDGRFAVVRGTTSLMASEMNNVTVSGTQWLFSNSTIDHLGVIWWGTNSSIVVSGSSGTRLVVRLGNCNENTTVHKNGVIISKGADWDCENAANAFIDLATETNTEYNITQEGAPPTPPVINNCTKNQTSYLVNDLILFNSSITHGTNSLDTYWVDDNIQNWTNDGNNSGYWWTVINTSDWTGTVNPDAYVNSTSNEVASISCGSLTQDDNSAPFVEIIVPLNNTSSYNEFVLFRGNNTDSISGARNSTFWINGSANENTTAGNGLRSVYVSVSIGSFDWYMEGCDEDGNCDNSSTFRYERTSAATDRFNMLDATIEEVTIE